LEFPERSAHMNVYFYLIAIQISNKRSPKKYPNKR
jgi:hypothetical protein